MNKRINWIDALRGFTIILVVLGHIERGLKGEGLFLNYSLQLFDNIIYSFHMPLMFMISGFLYGRSNIIDIYQPTKNQSNFLYIKKMLPIWFNYISKKIISFYIPAIIFTYCLLVMQIIVYGYEINYYKFIQVFYQPYSIYWFLYALMIITIFYSLIDILITNENIVFGISIFIYFLSRSFIVNHQAIGWILEYIGLGIFFYSGKIVTRFVYIIELNNRYKITEKLKTTAIITLLVLVISFICCNYLHSNWSFIFILGEVLVASLINIALFFLFKLFSDIDDKFYKTWFIQVLICIGKNSMVIYVIHTILTAGVRVILCKFGIYVFWIHVILATILGLGAPILLFRFCNQIRYLRWVRYFFYPADLLRG
ncbi:acyltransferase family protein [Oxobacter pfennigii]|uniref:Acyltransferase family protein n=1 Tax=Oxobacter pfennigii TaxID=36849 RepID=A0A0P8Y9V9_9CLOT|nr:acyltransferase [Oxobacter pfennigii]KPU43709.1 acyltransferase family protein [Oxobacter pfennigii]